MNGKAEPRGKNDVLVGAAYIIAAALLWASIGPIAHGLLKKGMDPLEIAFWRASLGSALFFTHSLCTHKLGLASRQDGLVFFCFGAICIGGFFSGFQMAVLHGSIALAAVLLYTAPAWVALFSRIIFNQPITRTKAMALLLCLVGVAFISFSGNANGSSVSLYGLFFGLLSGFLYATHFILNAIYLKRYTATTIYAWCLLFGAITLFPFITWAAKDVTSWLGIGAMGFICTYCAYFTYGEGLRRLNPVRAAVLATCEPVFAAIIAWLWWGEIFSALGMMGAACVIGAVVLENFISKECRSS